jgi:hypothetical protein
MKNKSDFFMVLLGFLIVFTLYYITLTASRNNDIVMMNSAIIVLILSLILFSTMLMKIINYKMDLDKLNSIKEETDQIKIEFLTAFGNYDVRIKSIEDEVWRVHDQINSVNNNLTDYKKINSQDLSKTLSNETFLKKINETMEEFRKEISTIYISKKEAAQIFKRKNNFDFIKESDEEATKK